MTAAHNFIMTATLPLMAMVALALISHSWINDSIQYRCVPTNYSSATVTNNTFYQAFGAGYYESVFNNVFCTSR